MIIKMFGIVGDFGEDKDAAAALRESKIKPTVAAHKQITLDFEGVTLVTQSFVHALISDVLRTNGEDTLNYVEFRNCVEVVRGIVSTVVQYSLETITDSMGEPDLPQSDKFVEAAREHGADEDESRWEERLGKVGKAMPKSD
jgi:hypothetical protein